MKCCKHARRKTEGTPVPTFSCMNATVLLKLLQSFQKGINITDRVETSSRPYTLISFLFRPPHPGQLSWIQHLPYSYVFCLFVHLLERGRGGRTGRERIHSRLPRERGPRFRPDTTLKSAPELKLRIGPSTDCATRAPLHTGTYYICVPISTLLCLTYLESVCKWYPLARTIPQLDFFLSLSFVCD